MLPNICVLLEFMYYQEQKCIIIESLLETHGHHGKFVIRRIKIGSIFDSGTIFVMLSIAERNILLYFIFDLLYRMKFEIKESENISFWTFFKTDRNQRERRFQNMCIYIRDCLTVGPKEEKK